MFETSMQASQHKYQEHNVLSKGVDIRRIQGYVLLEAATILST